MKKHRYGSLRTVTQVASCLDVRAKKQIYAVAQINEQATNVPKRWRIRSVNSEHHLTATYLPSNMSNSGHLLYLVWHCILAKICKRVIPTWISDLQSLGSRDRCLAINEDRLAFGWTRADIIGLMPGPGKAIPSQKYRHCLPDFLGWWIMLTGRRQAC